MGVPFPAIEPSSSAFSSPRHPATSARSESGIVDHRLWGSVAVDGALELEFRNIRTSAALQIVASFRDSYSGILPLDLPDILFAGYTEEDRAYINSITTEAGLRWYWPVGQDAPAPRPSLTFRHRCNLSVRLEARMQNEPAPVPPSPVLWVSRLTTATRGNIGNGGPIGSIVNGANQANFQAFWFEAVGGSAVRVVVVKRDAQGEVLWTRWTSAEFGDQVTSRDSWSPQIVALSDGGCIVFACAADPVTPAWPPTYRLRAWRLSSYGSQVWSKDYITQCYGAFKAALNGGEAIVYGRSSFNVLNSYITFRPALIRIDATSGAYISGSAYQIDGSNTESIWVDQDDALIVKTSSIVLRAAQNLLLEVSSNGATVIRAARLTALDGGIAALQSGGYICRNGNETLVAIDSAFNVTAAYRQVDAMKPLGTFYGTGTLAFAAGSDGTCHHIGDSFAGGEFFGVGVKIATVTNNGTTPAGYGEISYGSGISDQIRPGYSRSNGGSNDIDTVNQRGLVHIAGTGFSASACRVHAIGFDLALPTSTASNETPSRTLNTQGCGNTMSLRGWQTLSYTTATPSSITRTVPTIAVGSLTATESAGALNMVEATPLSWQTVRLDS